FVPSVRNVVLYAYPSSSFNSIFMIDETNCSSSVIFSTVTLATINWSFSGVSNCPPSSIRTSFRVISIPSNSTVSPTSYFLFSSSFVHFISHHCTTYGVHNYVYDCCCLVAPLTYTSILLFYTEVPPRLHLFR